jgi:hypothetical protein
VLPGPAAHRRVPQRRSGASLASLQACRVTQHSAVPTRLLADTMWMLHSRSPGYVAGTSTPYENGTVRRGYPVGYGDDMCPGSAA